MSVTAARYWSPAEWRVEFERRHGDEAAAIFDRVEEMFTRAGFGFRGSYKRKPDATCVYPVHQGATDGWPPPLCFRLDGQVEAPFQFIKGYGFDQSDRDELAMKLEGIPGLALDARRGRPTFPLDHLRTVDARQVFFDAYVWGYARIHRGHGADAPPPGCEVPPTREVTTTQVVRDDAVAAWVRKQAGGVCELCSRRQRRTN